MLEVLEERVLTSSWDPGTSVGWDWRGEGPHNYASHSEQAYARGVRHVSERVMRALGNGVEDKGEKNSGQGGLMPV